MFDNISCVRGLKKDSYEHSIGRTRENDNGANKGEHNELKK